jgi:hypothetical protein
MASQPVEQVSLYDALAARSPEHAPAGETVTTRQKETIDNDVEALELALDEGTAGLPLYDLLSDEATAGTAAGETRITKRPKPVDEAPADAL